MTSVRLDGAGPGPAVRTRPRAVLPALCVTQLTGWGIVYYAFPVLLPEITAATGWSAGAATAAFSGALLTSALAGIPVGRVLDRRGPRAVMTGGSVLATVALLAVAAAPNLLVFAAAWLLAGVAMAATFYHPAFAALTRWWGADRVRALTVLTLAGGLASTVFAPVTALLAGQLGWRGSYAVLAVVLGLITVPTHALALRAPWPPAPQAPDRGGTPVRVARSRPFLLLAAALTLSGFAGYAAVFGLVPLLLERSASPATAAWALGLGGAGQVLGRTLYAAFARRTGTTARTAALLGAGCLTTGALAVVPGPVGLLVVLAVASGTVRGNLTLLQATAVADRWGVAAYGRLSALLAAPVTLAGALAPWAGTALARPLGGHAQVFAVLAAAMAVAAVLALGTRVRASP